MRIAIVLHLTTNGCATSDVYRTYKISAASTVDLDNNGVVFIIRARLIGWKSQSEQAADPRAAVQRRSIQISEHS